MTPIAIVGLIMMISASFIVIGFALVFIRSYRDQETLEEDDDDSV